MGHSYGKLKYLDLLQVHFLAKMFIRLDFLYYCYTFIKFLIESQDLKHAKCWVLFHLVKHSMYLQKWIVKYIVLYTIENLDHIHSSVL